MNDSKKAFWKRVGEIVVAIITALLTALTTSSCFNLLTIQ